ncbi:MAG: hypothetical protein JST59_01535 [Actinobacteria bacterium]|nr:hypothetical protein [Actinomycetota bacterium]
MDVGGVLQQTIQKYEELLQQSTLSRDERFVLESSLANMRMQQATIRGIPRHRKAQSVVEISNSQEIENPESLKLPTPTKREILLKRLKPIFKFACREQQTTGINTTFDRINQECSIMNLGKFLMFCNAVKVPSEKLTRFVLIEKFKKNAEGFRDINFDKFVELLDTLQQIDSTLYDRIVVHDSPVAKSRLKSVRTPFAIHEKEYFRELRMPVTARK